MSNNNKANDNRDNHNKVSFHTILHFLNLS